MVAVNVPPCYASIDGQANTPVLAETRPMLTFTEAPEFHTGHPDLCERCYWQRLHYNLIHHVRVRGQEHI